MKSWYCLGRIRYWIGRVGKTSVVDPGHGIDNVLRMLVRVLPSPPLVTLAGLIASDQHHLSGIQATPEQDDDQPRGQQRLGQQCLSVWRGF